MGDMLRVAFGVRRRRKFKVIADFGWNPKAGKNHTDNVQV
jgi:hypothetical protein